MRGQQKVKEMSLEDKLYIAGLFDGDGYVGLVKTKHNGYCIRVTITTKYEHFASALSKITGLKAFNSAKNRKWKSEWRIQCGGRNIARKFLEQIYHYTILKKPQIEVALDWCNKGVSNEAAYESLKRLKWNA